MSPSTPMVSRLDTTQLYGDGVFTCDMAPNSPGLVMVAVKNGVASISIDSGDLPNLHPSDARTISSVIPQLPLEMVLSLCAPPAYSHATGVLAFESTSRALASRTLVAHETEGIPPLFFSAGYIPSRCSLFS